MYMIAGSKVDDRQDHTRYSTTQAMNGVNDQDLLAGSQFWLNQFYAELEALTRRFDDIVEAAELANTDDEHDPEGATIAFERSQASSLLRQANADRDAMRDTLGRLDDPAYGPCEDCGEFIGVERLMALPATQRCIRCPG